jgi:sigma-B regulation protein RsbU (phosphoserine phosphatase)
MVIREGRLKERLTLSGTPLGIVSDTEFAIREVTLKPGDLVFAFTDGLTETTNPAGVAFGEDQLVPLLSKECPLSKLLEQVQKRIEKFSAGSVRFDDITMLAVKRKT